MSDDATSGSGANQAPRASAERGSGGAGEWGIAVEGGVSELTPSQLDVLLDRGRASDSAVEDAVRVILSDVRRRGDEALRALARRFDRVDLTEIEIPRAAWGEALAALDPLVRAPAPRSIGRSCRRRWRWRSSPGCGWVAAPSHYAVWPCTRPAAAPPTRAACSWAWCPRA